MDNLDTIYALASARGRAGVAIIRVSGPGAFGCCISLAGSVPPIRHAQLSLLTHKGQMLDQALVLAFQKGASFTGEDVVEFHLHGGKAVIDGVLRSLSEFPGLRMAEAGEFTRRALENDCLDLAQVEGLSDLIEAETEAQRQQAFRVLQGVVGEKANIWRADLLRAAALLEATIDFVDEDVPVDVFPEVKHLIDRTYAALSQEIDGSFISEKIRDGFEVAIVGPPNIGKSTLLNTISGRDAAIISNIAGTTRDVIEVQTDLNGLSVTFLDMAGIRESVDEIESIGVERAMFRAGNADIRLFIISDKSDLDTMNVPVQKDDIVVCGKGDIQSCESRSISGKSGAGIDGVMREISNTLTEWAGNAGSFTRERHRIAMENAVSGLISASEMISEESLLPELLADELRLAVRALDSLIGRVDVEHILGEIFSSFCIGK